MFNAEEKEAVLDARFRRGEEAARLLAEPLLKQVLASMETDVISTMKSLRPNDMEGRDTCFRELRAVERFRRKLQEYVQSGQHAKKSLKQRIKDIL